MQNVQLYLAAFKEKEVKKEEEEKGLQIHFDSSRVDTRKSRIGRICHLSRLASFSHQQTFAFVHTLSSLCIHLCHNLQFLMKELTFIHSISDRSSIVLVQIPLKTARFTSFSSSFASSRVYLSCCCCCAPHIFNSPSVITGREGLLNCKFRNQIKFTRKNICSELQMTAQI